MAVSHYSQNNNNMYNRNEITKWSDVKLVCFSNKRNRRAMVWGYQMQKRKKMTRPAPFLYAKCPFLYKAIPIRQSRSIWYSYLHTRFLQLLSLHTSYGAVSSWSSPWPSSNNCSPSSNLLAIFLVWLTTSLLWAARRSFSALAGNPR